MMAPPEYIIKHSVMLQPDIPILYFDGHVASRTAESLYSIQEPSLYLGTSRYSWVLVQGLQKQERREEICLC